MGLNQLHSQLKWTNHFQIVNIHLPLIIYWTSKKFNILHLQEVIHGHMNKSLNCLQILAGNGSCIWDHMVVLHLVIWNALHVRIFMLTHCGVHEHVVKVCKSRPYVTTRNTLITNMRWLDGKTFIFFQLVWLLLFVMFKILLKKIMQGLSLAWLSYMWQWWIIILWLVLREIINFCSFCIGTQYD